MPVKKVGSLRRRWLINTAGVIFVLGLVCVLAVTASFAAYYYSNMQSDMENRAKTTTEFIADYVNQDYNVFYRSCVTYAQTFEYRNNMELQFIDASGKIVASSYGQWVAESPVTPEIRDAINLRGPICYVGREPATGERIIAVSSPVIHGSGQVVGVLRYVTSTYLVDMQILLVALVCLMVLVVVLVVVLLTSGYYIRSIMNPVAQITEKAKRIASGSYGSQIHTPYADEIGELADTINEMSVKISQIGRAHV